MRRLWLAVVLLLSCGGPMDVSETPAVDASPTPVQTPYESSGGHGPPCEPTHWYPLEVDSGVRWVSVPGSCPPGDPWKSPATDPPNGEGPAGPGTWEPNGWFPKPRPPGDPGPQPR